MTDEERAIDLTARAAGAGLGQLARADIAQGRNRLTDQEVCCAFMEGFDPRRKSEEGPWVDNLQWWAARFRADRWEFAPRLLTLDACHEIETRLTGEQWEAYEVSLERATEPPPRNPDRPWVGLPVPSYFRDICHATAEQKVAALAVVLRPIVEDQTR